MQSELFDTLITPERHARKPRFVEELGGYHRIRPYSHAPRYPYIETQSPTKAYRIVIDIDRDVRAIARANEWTSVLNCPPPNYALLNPANGHAHLFFELAAGVALYDGARRKPIEYLAEVERVLTAVFDGDVGYAGYLCKNARYAGWELVPGRLEPYTLGELFEYEAPKREEQPTSKSAQEKIEAATGLGRNCALFTGLRYWAYSAVHEYTELHAWHEATRSHAESLNVFPVQLQASEVRAIARSVAKWTWSKLGQDPVTKAAFIERQRFKQSRQAEKKRVLTTSLVVMAIAKLRAAGKRISKSAVAREIGCSQQNISKHYSDLF